MADSAGGERRGDPVALRCGYERLREAVLAGRPDGWRLGHGVLATRATVAWIAAVGALVPASQPAPGRSEPPPAGETAASPPRASDLDR